MIFELEESCFLKTQKTFELLQIASFVLKGRHRLYVKNADHYDYLNWRQELPQELADIWDLSLDYSMEQEAREPAPLTVSVCEISTERLSPSSPALGIDQASRLAAEPFRIFVENDDADRDFLITFSNDQQKRKIKDLESHNLIRFEHCGGIGELKKKIIKFANRHALHQLISIAVFDSDAPRPNDHSPNALAVVAASKEKGVATFMLKRRAIENYLLRSWLSTWINKSKDRRNKYLECFNHFCQLNISQRSHYHMKQGLSTDIAKISGGNFDLYDGLNDKQRDALMTGFGSDIGSELYSSTWVQESHPTDDPEGWNEVNAIVRDFLVLSR